jgi:hypothetical protein
MVGSRPDSQQTRPSGAWLFEAAAMAAGATHDIVAHRADAVLDVWLERMRLQ